jgi:K+-transporting ATPase ATPase C chain
MLAQLRRSIVLALLCLVFFGFVYAFAGTGVAQVLFRHQADGSITANGSTLIGQKWNGPSWFHGRPDSANPLVANGQAGESGSTNLGPRSKVLKSDTEQLIKFWHKEGVNPTSDLVTTSGSGLDPDITPQDAIVQIPMVSRATGIAPSKLGRLIDQHAHGRELGFLGSPIVNVLELNEGLAKLK